MFLLKKLLGALAMPLTFVLIFVAVACLLWLLRRRAAARVLLLASAALAYLSSTGVVANALLGPLTCGYVSPLEEPPHVKFVVVLGSGYRPRVEVPVTASLDPDGLARIVEGIRLVRKLPGASLVVSGGALKTSGQQPPAHGYARLAQSLGVDIASIIVLDKALDTASEARDIKARLDGEPFLLVTSSSHMRRAMRLMERVGVHAIAAPATPPPRQFAWDQLLPGASSLQITESAFHEYVGLLAISLGLD